MIDFDRLIVGPAFAALGRDAVYTPQAGEPVTIRVLPRLADVVQRFDETSLVTAAAVFELRVADIPSPQPGDSLTLDGAAYILQGEPMRDADRLVWTVAARPA